MSVVNSSNKYVFYGFSLYLLIGDIALKLIRDEGVKSKRLELLLRGMGYKGNITKRNLARFLYAVIDVEWMNSFIFVVDCQLIAND